MWQAVGVSMLHTCAVLDMLVENVIMLLIKHMYLNKFMYPSDAFEIERDKKKNGTLNSYFEIWKAIQWF